MSVKGLLNSAVLGGVTRNWADRARGGKGLVYMTKQKFTGIMHFGTVPNPQSHLDY